MPKRQARPRAWKRRDPQELMNMAVGLAVGPDFGCHHESFCGPWEDEEARKLARWWADDEIRADVQETNSFHEPFWASAVLDRGEPSPWQPDPRLPEDDPLQTAYRQEQERLSGIAREEHRRLKEGA